MWMEAKFVRNELDSMLVILVARDTFFLEVLS